MVENKYVFGVDVGGTSIKLGLFSYKGSLLKKWEIPTDVSNSGEMILPSITEFITTKLNEMKIPLNQVVGIGIGVPGPVDRYGIVHKCINLGWGNFSVSEKMHSLIDIPVKVNNDANLAALGESWQGCAYEYNNIIFVTLGTGVGGGIVYNKNLIITKNGSSGEIGHITVNTNETKICSCGKSGCLEQYASAGGIVSYAKELICTKKYDSSLNALSSLTAEDIFNAAKENDRLALDVLDYVGYYLGLGISTVSNTLDPDVIVIGGGISKAGDILINTIKKYYKVNAFHTLKDTEFRLATLGNDAGIYGAARLFIL